MELTAKRLEKFGAPTVWEEVRLIILHKLLDSVLSNEFIEFISYLQYDQFRR